MATYNTELPLSKNLANFGFGHREPPGKKPCNMGRRQIFNLANGDVVGLMDYQEAADMLKKISE